MGEPSDTPPVEGDSASSWHVDYQLRAALARLESRAEQSDERAERMAADLRSVKQVVGLIPANSLAPQARTYQTRTLIVSCAAVAAGVAFDKLVALLAALVSHIGN